MLSRILKVTACLFWIASGVTPARAAFQGPLETPASRNSLATRSQLTAVTNSGDRLVAVGARGLILLSDDNGNKWHQVAAPLSSNLVAVHFVANGQGWAVGHEGVVLHSGDGGRTWTKQLDGNQAARMTLTHYERLAAAGDSAASRVLPEAKRFVQEGADKPFLDVWFINANEGFVVGAFNLIMHTTDGGTTWVPLMERIDNPKALHMYAIKGSGEEVYIAGEMGMLHRWDRAIQRFVALPSPYDGSFFGLLVKDGTLIAFGMRGNAFRSKDRGKTWLKLDTKTTAGLTGGAFLEDGRVVLVSQQGEVLITDAADSKTFMPVKVAKPMPFAGVAPAGENGIVAVGMLGVISESLK